MLSIVIPAYNEEDRIGRTLEVLTTHFKNNQIIVVFDGNDRTPQVVSKFPVDLIVSSERLGKGGAIREGIKRSKGDAILLLDADLPIQTESLQEVVDALKDGDLVITTRVFRGLPASRGFLHRAFVLITKIFFPSLRRFRDFQAGLKVMRSEKVIQAMDELIINDWLLDVNLIYSFVRRGLKVREVEVPWSHEEGGSKVSRRLLKVSVMMFLSLVKLRTWYSPFRWILHTKIYLIAERIVLKALR